MQKCVDVYYSLILYICKNRSPGVLLGVFKITFGHNSLYKCNLISQETNAPKNFFLESERGDDKKELEKKFVLDENLIFTKKAD